MVRLTFGGSAADAETSQIEHLPQHNNMPATRSQTSKGNGNHGSSVLDDSQKPQKRKATDKVAAKPSKQVKIQEPSDATSPVQAGIEEEKHLDDDVVVINRAPVLELWAASVAHLLHPSMPWTTCLSIGGAISTISAISKGRAIGKMNKSDPESAQDKSQQRSKEQADLELIEVMGFHLHIKDGSALVGDKPRKSNEDALVKKFGPQDYERVKQAFETALNTWRGRGDELDKRAFHMYEDLRPNVAPGQKGWGRRGELSLKTIERAVCNSE